MILFNIESRIAGAGRVEVSDHAFKGASGGEVCKE